LEKNVYGLIANVRAKPFSESFDKQIRACEELYGVQLKVDKNICITSHIYMIVKESACSFAGAFIL